MHCLHFWSQELKQLMALHGGEFQIYYSRSTGMQLPAAAMNGTDAMVAPARPAAACTPFSCVPPPSPSAEASNPRPLVQQNSCGPPAWPTCLARLCLPVQSRTSFAPTCQTPR